MYEIFYETFWIFTKFVPTTVSQSNLSHAIPPTPSSSMALSRAQPGKMGTGRVPIHIILHFFLPLESQGG